MMSREYRNGVTVVGVMGMEVMNRIVINMAVCMSGGR